MSGPVAVPSSSSQWPTRQQITMLADSCDWVVAAVKGMRRATATLQDLSGIEYAVERAKEITKVCTANRIAEKLEYIDDLFAVCQPSGWSDSHAMVQKPQIAKMVALLLGSFPTSNIPDAAVFVRMLIDDLIALGPCRPEFLPVEGAFRELRQTMKFTPAICEIIAMLEKHEAVWDKRTDALCDVSRAHAELVEAIARAEQAVKAKVRVARIEHKPAVPMGRVKTSETLRNRTEEGDD